MYSFSLSCKFYIRTRAAGSSTDSGGVKRRLVQVCFLSGVGSARHQSIYKSINKSINQYVTGYSSSSEAFLCFLPLKQADWQGKEGMGRERKGTALVRLCRVLSSTHSYSRAKWESGSRPSIP